MNEISVVVKQEPGKVSWNFEEIKKTLENELEVYRTTAYTDATIKNAKRDVATLRKLPVAIKERLKEVKDKCLEPYAVIDAQAKELIDLIEEPIKAINEQVQDYEKRRKEAARKEILAYWNEKIEALPEDIREKAYTSIYDERWENATATKKSWKEGIDNGIKKILDEIETIKSFASEFEEDMLKVYKVDLSLQKAIAKMNELKAQQERILEIERKKQEAEQRRKEEEERQKQQAALNQQAAETLAGMMPPNMALTDAKGIPVSVPQEPPKMGRQENTSHVAIPAGNNPHQEEPVKMGQPETQTKAYPGGKSVRLLITGTSEQITKIQNYIRFTGATYQEV
ncbi:MAG: DUF1351 domain-containing protein [Lachnospiraceae bacterium]|nr:DUF1351 domain-containing protein [Lachnospiraceae bacterium]